MSQGRLPVGPLQDAVRLYGKPVRCYSVPIQRAYFRVSVRGWASLWQADTLAVGMLGEHPALIWGEDWWAECGKGLDGAAAC